MSPLRFAAFGCGYWSQFQIAAWKQLGGAELVALYNRTRSKAEALAERFGVRAVYDNPDELLDREELDFVDIITDVDAHPYLVDMAADHGLDVICQKPMAPDLSSAEAMVAACRDAGVAFAVHENWRWQTPIRALKRALDESDVGGPFRARITYSNSFPVFENQPFLREVEQFIIADMGSHILDVARFLFGEAQTVYCRTAQITPGIRGEDVGTVMMAMGDVTVTCEISYATRLEHDRFPEAFVMVECERGSVELAPDYWVRVTTEDGTHATRHPPPRYAWAERAYDLVQSSIVPCNADILRSLQTGEPAETSGEDNLKTVRLVYAAYESAATGLPVTP